MTIEDSLILLNNTKQSIKTAIEDKGVPVGSIPFSQYPGRIGDIPTGIDLPEIGEAYEGGYFLGLLFLSDGIYANIVSARSGAGDPGTGNYGTSTAWSGSDAIDPRIAMSFIPASSARTRIETINSNELNGYSDWMIPSWFQAMQYFINASARGWRGDADLGFGTNFWTSFEVPGSTGNCYMVGYGSVSPAGTILITSSSKNTNRSVRAFRIEKLD